MPLKRYEIRNEYSLADPELYKVADKDDPEAILEGVAMAGLVGVLRQLGDLAEFAAEIFHDLHEEVMGTAARGHGLIVRVQQLEAEFPSIERKLLSQTSHTSFLYNSSVDWHPNLRMDENTITQGDLPRFVMDSYEECRGPPRLFLLDKFDVAGAGACLKRFTDPSFFKTESASAAGRKLESQREKKTRRAKKRGPRWRNGETPESFPSSHAKLHQLFLEERIESGGNDPDRRVKLKKRQFTGSLFDQENTTSYMEKFLDTCSPEQRIVHEIIDPLLLTWTSNNASETGLEIVEIDTASPLKESIQYERGFCSSPADILVKPSIDEFSDGKSNVCIESEAVKELGLTCNSNDGNISTMTQAVNGKKIADRESKSVGGLDDMCDSDDDASEIDSYVDAHATIESEVETDSDGKKYPCYLSQPVVVDSDGSLGQRRLQGGLMDSQSVGNSATSEDGNIFFKGRGDSSCTDSVNAFSETTADLDVAIMADPSVATSNSDHENILSDHHFSSEEIAGSETKEHAVAHVVEPKINGVLNAQQGFKEISSTFALPGSNTRVVAVVADPSLTENSLLIDEIHPNSTQFDIASRERDQGDPDIVTWSSNGTSLDFPLKTDSVHRSSEHSINDQAGHILSVVSDTSPDAKKSSDLHQMENHKAHSVCSSVEEHTKDICHADVDGYSETTRSFVPPPISDPESPRIVNPICVPSKGSFILSTEGNAESSFSALDSKESFNVPEQHSEVKVPDTCTPSPDSVAIACSKEDPSFGEGCSPTEHEQRISCVPSVGRATQPPSSGYEMSDPAAVLSSSGIIDASEILECDSIEADVTDIASSGKVPASEIFPSYADGRVMDDYFKIGKPQFSLNLLESEDKHQNLNSEISDAALIMHCLTEAEEVFPRNGSIIQEDSGSIGEVDRNAAFDMLEKDVVYQDSTITCPAQTNVEEVTAHLNDPDTKAVNVEAEGYHALSDQIDGDNAYSEETVVSDIPRTFVNGPDSVEVAEDDGDLRYDVEKVEHVETFTNSPTLADREVNHNQVAVSLSSSIVHPQKLQNQFCSLTGERYQNGHEPTEGYKAELQNKLMNPVPCVLETNHNRCDTSTHVPSTIALHSLQAQDENSGKLITDDPSPSENSSQDVESASCEQSELLDVKPIYVDSHNHGLLKPMLPLEKAVDIASKVSSMHAFAPGPVILDQDFQPPGYVVREEYVDTAAVNKQSEPFVPKVPHQSAEKTLETTTESSVSGMFTGATHALDPERPFVYPSGFPVLGTPPSEHQGNLEAPPLPPLPPMQWRLGRFQNSASALGRRQTAGQVQVKPVCLPGVHNGPVQTMSLPTVHHTLSPVLPVALPAVHYTLAPAQPMTLPAMHHTLPAAPPMTLPTLEHQVVAMAQTSRNEGQPGFLDEYVALQGGLRIPMVSTASEGLTQSDMSAVGRQEQLVFSVPSTSGYMPLQGGFTPPMLATVSEGSSQDNLLLFGPSTSTGPQSDPYISENFHHPNAGPPKSVSSNDGPVSEHLAVEEASEVADIGAPEDMFVPKETEQEALNSSVQLLPPSTVHQPSAGFVASEAERTWLSTYNGTPTHAGGNANGLLQKKLRPRNPLIDEVVAIDKSKFRKVERVKPSFDTKAEEGESLREQMHLRKVEKVQPPEETKATEGGYILEQLQLRKVEERVKPAAESKSAETEFSSEQLQLRKVGVRVKPDVELRAEETVSPRVQLRKVSERIKQETEVRTEETVSPRVQLRKVGEKTQPVVELDIEERDSLFEQIRNKTFSLKPAVAARPNIQGPRTNLKVAAILEKASNIRQAMAGSDEDDDADTWSDC